MTYEEFMAFPITGIQEEKTRPGELLITFFLAGKEYEFYAVINDDDFYVPDTIHHEEKSKDCLFCGDQKLKLWNCSGLEPFKFYLFQRLISSNALRLSWLYRHFVDEKSDVTDFSKEF